MHRYRVLSSFCALGILLAFTAAAPAADLRKVSLKIERGDQQAVVTCVSASDGACYVKQGGSAAMPALRIEAGKSVQLGVVPETALLCYSADQDLPALCTTAGMAVSLERSTSVDQIYFGSAKK